MRTLIAAALAAAFVWSAHADERVLPIGDVPQFVEQAKQAGIDHRYTGGWEYFVGGGAAAFDCNGDRMPDLVLAGGASPAAFFVNRSKPGGALSFEAVDTGVSPDELLGVTGFYPLDIDNDGHMDLIALRVGTNLLLKGGPNCKFENASRLFAFNGGSAWTTAFAASFEAGATYPTLAFGNYVDRAAPGSPWGTCHDNVLMRPRPDDEGPRYDEPIALTPGYCALSMLFTDWDRSGTPALRITDDRQYYRGGEEQLWRVDAGKPPRLYRTADGWRKLNIWGMGIAEGDIDADGYPEYALTSMGDTKLQKLDTEEEPGRPVYRDIAWDRHATAHRPYRGQDLRPSTGWHSEFADFNNDGRLDLYIAKGNVQQMPDFAADDPDNLLLGQQDGTFAEAGDLAGIDLPTRGRGAVVEDFNADGKLDLLVVNREAPASLFRNLGARSPNGPMPTGNWLEIELRQNGANRDAVGAEVQVKSGTHTVIRKIQVGGGHASGHLGFVHVGLGVAERAEIRVHWPDGEWSAPYRVFADNFVSIERNAEAARYWYPPE